MVFLTAKETPHLCAVKSFAAKCTLIDGTVDSADVAGPPPVYQSFAAEQCTVMSGRSAKCGGVPAAARSPASLGEHTIICDAEPSCEAANAQVLARGRSADMAVPLLVPGHLPLSERTLTSGAGDSIVVAFPPPLPLLHSEKIVGGLHANSCFYHNGHSRKHENIETLDSDGATAQCL